MLISLLLLPSRYSLEDDAIACRSGIYEIEMNLAFWTLSRISFRVAFESIN